MLDGLGDGALLALIGGVGGCALGLAARLGRFCTLGAIEDFLYGGNDLRLRMWGLAIGVAMTASFGLMAAGLLDPAEAIYNRIAWNPAASVIGGLLFGYGMALAGNCGFGALARLGGGDLRSFVVVLVLGVSAYATASGPIAWARIRVFPEEHAAPETAVGYAGLLERLTGLPATAFGIALGIALIAWILSSRTFRASPRYILWGSIVGLAVASGWAGSAWISDGGFGMGPVMSHSFAAPLGESILWLMTATGGGLSFAEGSVLGVLVGAFVGSLIKGHFRWEACEDPRELRRQILGAAIMGVGAILAFGCTIGQGISAFSVLAYSAPVVFMSILAGAAIGLRQLIEGFSRPGWL